MARGVFWIGAAMLTAAVPAAPALGDATEQFAVEEYGRVNCEQFISARQKREAPAYNRIMGFVQGYLTAANRYEPDTFDLSPWHNAAAFDLILDKHCRDRPKDTLVGTLQMMVSAFRPLRVAKSSGMVRVSDGKATTYVYDTILRRSEMFLKARGYLTGQGTGAYTPELREAFRKFQQDKGLSPTGMPDPATLWTLLNP